MNHVERYCSKVDRTGRKVGIIESTKVWNRAWYAECGNEAPGGDYVNLQ